MTTATSNVAVPNLMLSHHASALREHVLRCQRAQGRWFPAARVAERLHALIAPRFVTTVAVVALVLAFVCG